MWRSLWLSLALTCTAQAAAPWWQPLGPIQKGNFGGGYVNPDDKLTPAETKAALATSFKEWTTYEDDLVRFKYPRDPSIKLEVIKRGQPVKVEGGVCTTVDNSFQQAYALKVGGAAYGLFLLGKADWLDDGICLCGPMIHHVYSMRNGCLVRYSLLPGHAVKKAQWLGGGLRLMAFEWTHLACPREIYQAMIDSMVLKIPSKRTEQDLRDETYNRYAQDGRAGWLHPGQTEKEILAIMHVKPEPRGTGWLWKSQPQDERYELEVTFDRNRKMVKTSGWERRGYAEGSLSWLDEWMVDQKYSDDPFAPEEKQKITVRKALPPGEVVKRLLELSANCPENRRRDWLKSVHKLAERVKHRDPALLAETLRHATGRQEELDVLDDYQYPELQPWLLEKLENIATWSTSHEPDYLLKYDAVDLLKRAHESAPAEASGAVDKLLAVNTPWSLSAVMSSKQTSPGQARQAITRASDLIEKLEGYAAEALSHDLVETAREGTFDDPVPVKDAVDRLATGKMAEWYKANEERAARVKAMVDEMREQEKAREKQDKEAPPPGAAVPSP